MSKLTFKKQPMATGLASIAAGTPSIDILMDGEEVGMIDFNDSMAVERWHPERVGKIMVRLMFPASSVLLAKNPNCPWMWVIVKEKFTDGDQAKAWVLEHSEWVIGQVYSAKAKRVTA
jgi:hypothetical protein